MRIGLICDTHIGVRSDSITMMDHQHNYFSDIFIPAMKFNDVGHIIHLGDLVDKRRFISFQTANFMRQSFFEPLSGYPMTIIAGNHDTFFKNTNKINALNELVLDRHKRVTVVDEEPLELKLDDTSIALVPWICESNRDSISKFINDTKAQICMGHFELQGFEMYRGTWMDHGMSHDDLSKFDMVMSGHFHHKSTRSNVHYLGAPYEMTWADYDDPRGFHIFDTQTRELTFIRNHNRIFHKIEYDDSNTTIDKIMSSYDFDSYNKGYVKILTRNKSNPYWFDLFIDKIQQKAADVKIVEDSTFFEDQTEVGFDQIDDMLSLLLKTSSTVISESVSKADLEALLKQIYHEAQTIET